MSEENEAEEYLVEIYMVQVGKALYQTLRAEGEGYDYGINAYLRRRLGKPAPVYPDCSDDLLDDEAGDDSQDMELLNAIPVRQGPRVPPHSVPIEGDLYDMLVEATATPERKMIRLLEEMVAEMSQSQSRSR